MGKNAFQYVILVFFIPCFLGACKNTNQDSWELLSPDKSISFKILIVKEKDQPSGLVYGVEKINPNGRSVIIENSPLGLIRKDQQFSENLSFVSASEIMKIDETYEMKIGRQKVIRNKANELALIFQNDKGSRLQVVIRAYDDGVAFRYFFPGNADSNLTVTEELTGFNIPDSGMSWIEPYDVPSKWTPAYEKFYENGIPIGTSSPNKEGWAFPALFQSNGNWILISEANLSPSYCGIRLKQDAPNGLYSVRFPEAKDAEGTGVVEPSSVLPWTMPWRAIIIGNTPGAIIESQMINNLSDKSVPGDFSWVKPGRSSWSWLSDNESPKNYAALKSFIDLSAQMGWEYSLVDANWDLMEGGSIAQLVKYAETKRVGILMWYNSGGPHNIVTERPRDIISNPELRKAEFKKLHQWGVKGIKVDFWHSDKQNLITLYHDVLKDAAEEKIMVNFHGCTIPRGWSRTYPNLLSMEAVRGEECYLFDSLYTFAAPVQNSILPFTRNAIGPMDYTPFGLTNFRFPHNTTYAHELALTLIFNTGIIHFADNVKMYSSLPGYVKDFLRKLPVVFDETHYISGEPGKSVILAARNGNTWYVSGINGEAKSLANSFTLPFLDKGKYSIHLIKDGADKNNFDHALQEFNSGEKLNINMLPFGGFTAVIEKK
jgi:alpha-glucosidase